MVSTRMLINACRLFATRKEFPAVNAFSRDVLERTARKWGIEL